MKHILLSLLTICSLFTLLATAEEVVEIKHSPFTAVQLAQADILAITALNDPKLNPNRIRYLSQHNIVKEQRRAHKKNVDMVLNSQNPRYRRIVRTASLPANSDDPVVIRVNLDDYGISDDAWNELAEKGSGPIPIPDPYFHTTIDKKDIAQQLEVIKKIKVKYSIVPANLNGAAKIFLRPGKNTTVTFDDGSYSVDRDWTISNIKTPDRFPYDISAEYKLNDVNLSDRTTVYAQANHITTIEVELISEVIRDVTPNQKDIYTSSPLLAIEQDPQKRGSTIASLIQLTGTKNPILRADWYVTYSVMPPAYYRLIGLTLKDNPDKEEAKKKPKVFLEKDFEDLFRFRFQDAREDIVAAITDTKIVTLHNRIIHRFSTVVGQTGGYYYKSQDTDTGIDDEDYLEQIHVFDKAKIKAQEIISSGRNGLNFYCLTNDKRVLLDVAAAAIAIFGDRMPTKMIDKQVYAGRSCMLCHAGGQIYLKDKVRNLARGKVALFINDKTKNQDLSRKIQEAFEPDTKTIIDGDNAKFLAAVKATTDEDGKVIGRSMENMIHEYYDQPVTLEKMALEVGIERDKLEGMLKEGINLHYTLTAVIADEPEDISRIAWERQGYPALVKYILGYQPRLKK